jgi:hypothetical protein
VIKAFSVTAAAIGLIGWLIWSALTAPPEKPKPLSSEERARLTCEAYLRDRHPEYTDVDGAAAYLGSGTYLGEESPVVFTGPRWRSNGDGAQYMIADIDEYKFDAYGNRLLDEKKSREFWYECIFSVAGDVDHVKSCAVKQPPNLAKDGHFKAGSDHRLAKRFVDDLFAAAERANAARRP